MPNKLLLDAYWLATPEERIAVKKAVLEEMFADHPRTEKLAQLVRFAAHVDDDEMLYALKAVVADAEQTNPDEAAKIWEEMAANPWITEDLLDELIERKVEAVLDISNPYFDKLTKRQVDAVITNYRMSSATNIWFGAVLKDLNEAQKHLYVRRWLEWQSKALTIHINNHRNEGVILPIHRGEFILTLDQYKQFYAKTNDRESLLKGQPLNAEKAEFVFNAIQADGSEFAQNSYFGALAENPTLPDYYLWFLHNEEKHWPKLAMNPSLPQELYLLFLERGNGMVLTHMLDNPKTPEDVFNRAIERLLDTFEASLRSHLQDGSRARRRLMDDMRLRYDTRKRLFEYEVAGTKGKGRGFWSGNKEFLSEYFMGGTLTEDQVIELLRQLAKEFEKPEPVLKSLLQSGYAFVTPDIIQTIDGMVVGGGSDRAEIRAKLGSNPLTPVSILKRYAKSSDHYVADPAKHTLKKLTQPA